MSEMGNQENTNHNVKKNRGERAFRAVACVFLAFVFFWIGWLAHWFSLGEQLRSLIWAVKTAKENYYQPVDEEKLFEDMFAAFSLDPYSEYYTKEQYAEIFRASEGSGSGMGVSITVENEKIRLFRVAGNSPAEQSGLMRGMYLHRFGSNESSLTAGDSSAFIAFVQAQTANSSFCVEAGFDKGGEDAKLYTVTMVPEYTIAECLYRDNEVALRFDPGHGYAEIPLEEIGGLKNLPSDTAYIRLDEFFGMAATEIEYCLNYMKAHEKSNLILDLRSNGGGYLTVFQQISAFLMREAEGKRPIVTTARFRSGREVAYYAPANRFYEFFTDESKIYILADERTASASECLIGTLVSYKTTDYSEIFLHEQENGVARSYGKGIMQSHYTDSKGNVLKLTCAEIFWPNGNSIHGVGVTKADGAIGIPSPLVHGKEDTFLTAVIAQVSGNLS